MYPTALGTTFMVQQRVPSGGTFDGTEQGRASATIGSGNAQIVVRSRLYGTPSNSYRVSLVDLGAGVTHAATSVELIGHDVRVKLRRTSGGLAATAAEVAAAINAASATPGFPVVADAGGTGAGVMAAASNVALTGGLDAAVAGRGSQFKYTYQAGTNGGLFYFENDEPVVLRQVMASFAPATSMTVKFEIVNLTDGLAPITGLSPDESIAIVEMGISTSETEFSVSDVRLLILPNQALRVICNAPGVVRAYVRREARFSSL